MRDDYDTVVSLPVSTEEGTGAPEVRDDYGTVVS